MTANSPQALNRGGFPPLRNSWSRRSLPPSEPRGVDQSGPLRAIRLKEFPMEDQITARDEQGATTAEYAACTGGAVGFAALLFKFLTSEGGQKMITTIFGHVMDLLPF